MTFKEFKEIIERTGEYQVSDIHVTGKTVHRDGDIMCYISDVRTYKIDTVNSDNGRFLEEYGDILFEFVVTPIGDRYPAKKYYAKLDLPHILDEEECYLNRHTMFDGNIAQWIGSKNDFKFEGSDYQTQFTMEEIEEIIPKEDMDKFKLIPVEEEYD